MVIYFGQLLITNMINAMSHIRLEKILAVDSVFNPYLALESGQEMAPHINSNSSSQYSVQVHLP